MKSHTHTLTVLAFAFALVMVLGALAACSSGTSGGSSAGTAGDAAASADAEASGDQAAEDAEASDAEGTEASEAEGESTEPASTGTGSAATAAVQVDADVIESYCGGCHFKDVENMAISSWNKDTIDFAMVESMVPFADDATIQGIVDYFAGIEPAADEGGAH